MPDRDAASDTHVFVKACLKRAAAKGVAEPREAILSRATAERARIGTYEIPKNRAETIIINDQPVLHRRRHARYQV